MMKHSVEKDLWVESIIDGDLVLFIDWMEEDLNESFQSIVRKGRG